MPKQFDKITLKVHPAGTLNLPWTDLDRAIILINNRDILDIVREEEHKLYLQGKMNKDTVGRYHHIYIPELYDLLTESEKSQGKEEASVLCCVCDCTGCDGIDVNVIRTKDFVLWKDIRNRARNSFHLTFTFTLKDYENFMEALHKHSLKYNK